MLCWRMEKNLIPTAQNPKLSAKHPIPNANSYVGPRFWLTVNLPLHVETNSLTSQSAWIFGGCCCGAAALTASFLPPYCLLSAYQPSPVVTYLASPRGPNQKNISHPQIVYLLSLSPAIIIQASGLFSSRREPLVILGKTRETFESQLKVARWEKIGNWIGTCLQHPNIGLLLWSSWSYWSHGIINIRSNHHHY